MKLLRILAIILVGTAIILVAWLMKRPTEIIVEIRAQKDIVNDTIEIKAGQTVSQYVVIEPARVVDRVMWPIVVGEGDKIIRIELRKDDAVLVAKEERRKGFQVWRQDELSLSLKRKMFGQYELVLRNLSDPQTGGALKVYFEPADEYYPDGQHAIDGELKRGDVAVKLLGKGERRYSYYLTNVIRQGEDLVDFMSKIGWVKVAGASGLLGLLLGAGLIGIWTSWLGNENGQTKGECSAPEG